MAKDVGAKKVIMASCAPPIRYPNVYGIDMPSRTELVAHGRTMEEVAEALGADLVIFQTLEDLVASVRGLNPSIEKFECSVFFGGIRHGERGQRVLGSFGEYSVR
jgi:amidophosphoribosyltransferase